MKSIGELVIDLDANRKGRTKNMAKKIGKTLAYIALCIIVSCIMVAVFLGAVLQQSYRMCPPTDEEIAENPALEVYRP